MLDVHRKQFQVSIIYYIVRSLKARTYKGPFLVVIIITHYTHIYLLQVFNTINQKTTETFKQRDLQRALKKHHKKKLEYASSSRSRTKNQFLFTPMKNR